MENFEDKIRAYMEKEKEVLEKLPTEDINKVINVLEEARKKGAVVYVCGNGGSAATAAHYVTDFNKGISLNQKHKYNLISLNDNIPSMTAIANDIGYEHIFEIQLQGIMTRMDSTATTTLRKVVTTAHSSLEPISCQGLTGRVCIRYPSSPRTPL